MAVTAIKRCTEMAKKPLDAEALSEKLEQTRAERDRLKAQQKVLLPVEREAQTALSEKIRQLTLAEQALLMGIKLDGKYLILNPSPLTWRNRKGLPLLVPFSLESSATTIGYESTSWDHTDFMMKPGRVYSVFCQYYQDLKSRLYKKWSYPESKYYRLDCKFSGVIPDWAREKIKEAQGDCLEVFLIAEPSEMTLRKVEMSLDPLIVGVDNGGQFWLVADFETTTAEEAMIFIP